MNGPFLPQLKFQSDTKISSPFGIQSIIDRKKMTYPASGSCVDFSDSIADVDDEMGVTDGELIDATALVNCPWRSNIFPVSKLDGLSHFVPIFSGVAMKETQESK